MIPTSPPVPAAGPRLLRDDPLARAAAWIWVTVPRRLVARLPFLRDAAGDGHFLVSVPAVAVFLPVACVVAGFWVGAHHWGYDFALTESVFLLSALVALGAFATQLGLLALVGYAVGDFFVRFTAWSYTVVDLGSVDFSPGATSAPVARGDGLLDSGIVAGLWRVRVPMILLYLLLGVGAVVVPRLARGLAGVVLRSARVPPHLDWLVASFAYLVTVWLAVTGWAASLPLLIRPYFTWKGGLIAQMPPAQATVPIQNFRQEIVAAAVVAALVRQLVVWAVERDRRAAARVDVVVSLAASAPPARNPTRRGLVVRVVGTALLGTLLMAGTLERAWTWALAAGVFLAIAWLRSDLVPRRLLAAWQRLAGRAPLLVRVVVVIVAVRVVAGFVADSVISSYESLAVFILLAALGSVLLLPPPAPVAETDAAGRPGSRPRPPVGGLRTAGLLLLATAGALVYLAAAASPAFADNCGTLADCFPVAQAMANAASAAATIAPIAMAAGGAGAAAASSAAAAPSGAEAAAGPAAVAAASPAAAAGAEAAAQARTAAALGQAPVVPLPTAAAPGPAGQGLGAVRALEDVVPRELVDDPEFVALWTPGFQTNAMVAVQLPPSARVPAGRTRLTAPVRQNGAGLHAEEVGLAQGDLRWAVGEALAAGSPQQPAVVRLLVNRTPCTGCAQLLADQLRDIRAQLTPEQDASIRFELVASGAYEASEGVPEDAQHLHGAATRFAEPTTTTRSIRVLLEAGWDARALQRGGVLSERGEWWAGAVDAMRGHLGLAPLPAPPPAVDVAAALSPTSPVPPPAPVSGAPVQMAQPVPPPAPISGAPVQMAQPVPPPAPISGAPVQMAQPAPSPEAVQAPAPAVQGAAAGARVDPAVVGEAWRELRGAGTNVPAERDATAALGEARQVGERARQLLQSPTADARPAMQAAFEAATVGHRAATVAYQAYGAAYQAAQAAGRVGGPSAALVTTTAEAAHQLSQQANAEYQAAVAANSIAQGGGPHTAHHAAQAAHHAERAASLSIQASQTAARAIAAAGQAVHGAGRARTFESDDAAADYGRQVWAGLLDRLTPGQKIAASDYSGSFYRTINPYLWGQIPASALSERDQQFVREDVPELDAALSVQPTIEDVMVVRVTTPAEFDTPVDRLEGTVQSNPAYFSTSLATGPRFGADEHVILHLNVPAGTPALFMEATYMPTHGSVPLRDLTQELLLGRDTRYLVESAVSIGGRWHVYGRVLPPAEG